MLYRNIPFLIVSIFIFALLVAAGGTGHAGNNSYSEAFAKVNPAVVKLVTLEGGLSNEPRAAVSSGVVISEEGQILTAAHVVNVADKIAVKFTDNEMVEAKVVS